MRFTARKGVSARFGDIELGVVEQLEIEDGQDLPHMGNTLYVCGQKQDAISFVAAGARRIDTPSQVEAVAQAEIAMLELSHQGARYRALAFCCKAHTQPSAAGQATIYAFETVERPSIKRFGVSGLAAALLLDALEAHEEAK
jgi:hypothetical protein